MNEKEKKKEKERIRREVAKANPLTLVEPCCQNCINGCIGDGGGAEYWHVTRCYYGRPVEPDDCCMAWQETGY